MKPIYFSARPEIIHSLFHPLPEFAKEAKIRCQTVHDIIPLLFDDAALVRKVFQPIADSAREADLVITVSESTRRDLLKLGGFQEENVVTIHLAADPCFRPASEAAVEEIRRRLAIPDGVPYFLSVSTLEPRKNFPFLLKAFQRLISLPDTPPCRLILIGKTGWDAAAHDEIHRLLDELKEHVGYPGFVTDEDLRTLYTGAEMFLFPSLYEGFGLPLLESMACGTPVISSNTSSMPEVTGDAGILLPPMDEGAWVEAMRHALQRSSEQKQEASRRALDRASEFSWEKTAEKTLEAYRMCLDRSKK
ncbi:MAG: glycosyltransferase family 1 protein [Luteolibacter sp.]